jgi:tRNA(fMet)-specific endonuclease VapC
MGLMIDTNVFIHFERTGKAIDLSPWEPTERVYVSVLTVSELLMGVHRADTEARRQRRSDFVEEVISRVGVLDFTIACARVHAEIYAELARKGELIGAHDLNHRCHCSPA